MSVLLVGKPQELIRLAKKHRHDCWEIVIPTFGQGFVETSQQKVPFCVGTMYVVPPFTDHTTHSEELFSDIYIQTDAVVLNTQSIVSISSDQCLPKLGELILDSYLNRHQGFRGTLEAALSLIIQLIRDHYRQSGEDSLPYRIRSYLIRNMDRSDMDMSILTKEFGYCSDHIRRIFKQAFGTTPMDFLNTFRLSHAKKLLRNMPIYTVADICSQCGYADRFYFSRLFKNKTGMTPSQYRSSDTE